MPEEATKATAACPLRIVSGGQTGVDRAALEAAERLGIARGGWCPRGRRAEDGRIPDRYPLRETESARYVVRTERNVRDSEATLILHRGPLRGGTRLTERLARGYGRPCLRVDLEQPPATELVRRWLVEHAVAVLNVAGPRESQAPGIAALALAYLLALWEGEKPAP